MTILWHNPRCSKSRGALQLLRENGIDPDIRLYLKLPPSVAELTEARDRLGVHTIEMVRTREAVFAQLDLADGDDEALIAAMAAHPILIERPVVFHRDRAVIARPPEALLDLL